MQTNSVPFHLFNISRIVRFIDLESVLLDAGGVGRAKESLCLMRTEFQLRKVKDLGDG